MSKIKPDRAHASVRISRFAGLGQEGAEIDPLSVDIENFRIRSDGTLKKRNGYLLLRRFPALLRGYWEGEIENQFFIFAVAGSKLYRIDPITDEWEIINTLASSKGQIDFLLFEEHLYIPDASSGLLMYNISSNTFAPIDPYVPLYGVNWDPVSAGQMNEELKEHSVTSRPSMRIASTLLTLKGRRKMVFPLGLTKCTRR